jgi:exodeoxyribonuclease VII small subunit
MEGEKLPLEKLLELYEEGTNLVKVCQEKLDSAEKRIEIISRNQSGKPRLTEFDPASTAAAVPQQPTAAKPAPLDPGEVSLF